MKTLKIAFAVVLFASFTLQVVLTKPQNVNLWGITIEGVDNYADQTLVDSLVSSLSSFPLRTTSRIVLDPDDDNTPNPGTYNTIIPTINTVSNVMAEILDSYYWDWDESGFEFTKTKVVNRLVGFYNDTAIRNNVTIWEVGNEVNGTWVYQGNTELVQETMDTLLKILKNAAQNEPRKTAITFYFYPNVNCVENQNEPEKYLMSNWAEALVKNYPDVVNNLDYVFISYYRDANEDCNPDVGEGWFWNDEVANLMSLFPYSKVGFGEVGWSTDNPPSNSTKVDIVNTYYSYYPPFAWPNIPWTRAGFYWNYVYDCLESANNYNFRTTPVWIALDSLMGVYGASGDYNRNANKIYTPKKSEYTLENNYPNPFNPITNIKFSIPKSDFVTLKVYDISGREIKSLVNEYKNSGSYIVSFNGSELASGIYFYKIQAGMFTQVKRMILIK